MRIFDDFNLDHKRNARNTPIYDYNCMGYALDTYSWLIAYLEDEETDAFNGSENKELSFDPTDFTAVKTSNSYDVELSTVYTKPDLSQTIAGTYTAVMVNSKGVVQAGNRAFAFIDAGAAIPSDVMIGGLIFEATE